MDVAAWDVCGLTQTHQNFSKYSVTREGLCSNCSTFLWDGAGGICCQLSGEGWVHCFQHQGRACGRDGWQDFHVWTRLHASLTPLPSHKRGRCRCHSGEPTLVNGTDILSGSGLVKLVGNACRHCWWRHLQEIGTHVSMEAHAWVYLPKGKTCDMNSPSFRIAGD
jgi:hypothetical protein